MGALDKPTIKRMIESDAFYNFIKENGGKIHKVFDGNTDSKSFSMADTEKSSVF